jgi:hypothetical protein
MVKIMTPQSSHSLSGTRSEEVLRAEMENRAWSKTLRQQATALLNSRLAKKISFEEYTVFRQQANKDAAECKQQGKILGDEIPSRDERYVLQSNLQMNTSSKFTAKY